MRGHARAFKAVFLVLLVAAIPAGCGQPSDTRPPLPALDTTGLRPVARAHLDEALARAAANEAAVPNLAMVLHAYQLFPQADTVYRRARIDLPGDALLAYAHGRVLQELGRYDAAQSALETAERDERFATLACARLLEGDLARGRAPEALNRAQSCLESDPDSGELLALAARAAWQGNDAPRAARHLGHAQQLGLRHASLAYTGALIARAAGDEDTARIRMAQFRRLTELHGDWPDPLMTQINGLRRTARSRVADVQARLAAGLPREAAIEQLEDAVTLDPDAYEAHALLIGLYGAAGNLPAAEMHFARAVALAPGAAQIHVNVATARAAAGHNETALEAFDKALALAPDHANARALRARTLFRLGRRDEAITEFEQAVDQDPLNASVRQLFARALLDEAQFSRAAEILSIADPSPAEDARRLLLLSRVWRADGRFDEAGAALVACAEAARFLSDRDVDIALRRETALVASRRRD